MSCLARRVLLASLFSITSSQDGAGISDTARQALERIEESYRVEIIAEAPQFPVETIWGPIDGTKAASHSLETYIPLFSEEFTLYPPALIKRAILERIVLCEELSFAGQVRAAIPDYVNDTLYLDVRDAGENPSYFRKAIHHEFFHLMDFRDDGDVYADSKWSDLNRPEFSYGAGGVSAQDTPETSWPTDKYPGFLNHYSTTGVEEDKAELFAYLMVESEYVKLRTTDDAVLRAKVDRMRRLLFSFCPHVDQEFWETVEKKERADESPLSKASRRSRFENLIARFNRVVDEVPHFGAILTLVGMGLLVLLRARG